MKFTGERLIPGETSEELYIEHLQRYLAFKKFAEGKVVLDAGFGEGYGSILLAECACEVYAIDVSQEMVDYARDKYKKDNLFFEKASLEKIPFGDKKFDLIYCFEVIEHVNEDIQNSFLSETKRLLKDDGVLIVSTPNKKEYSDRYNYKNEFHVKEFYEEEYFSFLNFFYNNITVFNQEFEVASVLTNIKKDFGNAKIWIGNEVNDPKYMIAVCSDANINISELESSVYLTPGVFQKQIGRIIELQNVNNQMQSDYSYLTKDVQIYIDRINQLQNVNNQMQSDYNNLSNDIQVYTDRIKNLEQDNERSIEKIRSLEEKIANLQMREKNKQGSLEVEIKEKDNEIRLYQNKINEVERVLETYKSTFFWKLSLIYYRLVTETKIKYFHKSYRIIKEFGKREFLKRVYYKLRGLDNAEFNKKTKVTQKIVEVLKQNPEKAVILYLPVLDYQIELFQRPQHLAKELSRLDYLFLYLTPNYRDNVSDVKQIDQNLWLVNCWKDKELQKIIDTVSENSENNYLIISSTDNKRDIQFIKRCMLRGYHILYEYIDEIDERISGTKIPDLTLKRHEYILETEEITVIATAEKLYQNVGKKRNGNYFLITNGVDYKHFSKYLGKELPINDGLQIFTQMAENHPIIGYFGAFSSWFDYELIRKLSLSRPDYEIVLIGLDHDGSLQRSNITGLKNVHYLGTIDYQELPAYACHFNVAMIPFLINEITIAVSPIKLFEYMALNKPIVTTALPECERTRSAIIAHDHDDFISKVDLALTRSSDIRYITEMDLEARQNSWENKARELKIIFDTSKEENKYISDKNDILFFSIIDWDFRYQRPQHLCDNFVNNGRRVFFINASFVNEKTKVEKVKKNLYKITLKYSQTFSIYKAKFELQSEVFREIDQIINKFNIKGCDIVVEYPNWYPVAEHLQKTYNYKLIFDYLDEFEGFHTADEYMIRMNKTLLEKSNLLITTSDYLTKQAQEINSGNIETVKNGAEFKHFFLAEKTQVSRRPVIGYYGAIADWFDAQKVLYIAENHPEWEIRLIGSYEFCKETEKLKKHKNIKLFGEIPYQELPGYVKDFDVCLIPFRADLDLIKATNPVKFYEYLASGKKIVATEIDELKPFAGKFVYLENDNQTFCRRVEDCINNLDDLASYSERFEFAKQNDWSKRAEIFLQAVDKLYTKASIVILTFNNLEMNKDCIESILQKTQYPNFEIIVVDNDSKDGTPDYLRQIEKEYPFVKIHLNRFNAGFAEGNNLGLQMAEGQYLILLNNDTIVTKGWLTTLIKHLDKDPLIGMIGPVTNSIGNEAKIEVPYSEIMNRTMDIFAASYTQEHMNELFDIKVLAMFCTVFRRSLLDEIGYLDENFEIGMFEDDDYSIRVKNAGYSLKCAEDTFIHHRGRSSFILLGDEKYMQIFNKNKKVFEEKHGIKFEQHNSRKNK